MMAMLIRALIYYYPQISHPIVGVSCGKRSDVVDVRGKKYDIPGYINIYPCNFSKIYTEKPGSMTLEPASFLHLS
jgi:hypothetical protein